MELRPCWKCGQKPMYVKENGYKSWVVSDYVSCAADCMPHKEKYTVDEWQNHPRKVYSIEYPGGTMNQDGTVKEIHPRVWVNENGHAQFGCSLVLETQKKKSWLQKIRDYDNLQSRCNSAEAMRDHYKTIMTEALHDRDLHATVADVWQQRLICVQKDLMDATEMIGKRLKFSVGHNHVTIIVGNPVTYAENYNEFENGEEENTEWVVSKCSPKDTYNWKTGVVQALDNLCDEQEALKVLRRDLRKALEKKYPEVF